MVWPRMRRADEMGTSWCAVRRGGADGETERHLLAMRRRPSASEIWVCAASHSAPAEEEIAAGGCISGVAYARQRSVDLAGDGFGRGDRRGASQGVLSGESVRAGEDQGRIRVGRSRIQQAREAIDTSNATFCCSSTSTSTTP